MSVRLRIDPEVDEGRLDDFVSWLQGLFGGAGESAGSSFGAGLLSGITSGSRVLGGITEAAAGMGAGVSAGAAVAVAGLAGIGVAAAAAGQELYAVGERFDALEDSIAASTGRMGDDFDALNQSLRDVGANTASSMEDLAGILSDVAVSLRLTGEPLEDVTKQLADLERFTGQNVDIRDLGMAWRGFGEDAGSAVPNIDALYNAFTQTHQPINELLSTMVAIGPQARTLGLTFDETANLLIKFEEAGINSSRAVMALNQAASNAAEAGIPLNQALEATISQIKQFLDAGEDTKALTLSEDMFGKRGAELFVDAVRNNVVTVDTLNEGLSTTGTTIAEMDEKTKDWEQTWQLIKNRVSEAADEIGGPLFDAVNSFLQFTFDPFPELPSLGTGQAGPNAPSAGDLIGLPQSSEPNFYKDWYPNQPTGPTPLDPFLDYTSGPLVPGAPLPDVAQALEDAKNKGGSGSSPGAPAIPFPAEYGQPPGPGETFEDWQKRQRLMEAEHDLAEKRAALTQLQQDNNATADEITRAENAIAQAENRVLTIEQQNLEKRQQILDAVQVPYPAGYGQPPRPGETAEQYGREQSAYEAIHKRQEAEARLAQVQSDTTKNQNDVIDAENDLAAARQNEYQAMLRLTESGSKAADQLTEVGAKLDADFGLSEGLPGLAENLFKFLANLAAAPVLGALGAVSSAGGGEDAGSGLTGLLAASGAFGPQFQLGTQTDSGLQQGLQNVADAAAQAAPTTQTAQTTQATENLSMEQVDQIAAQFGLTRGSTYRNEPGSYHNLNQATDYNGSPEDMAAFANYMATNYPSSFNELIHSGSGTQYNVYKGQQGPVIDQPGSVYNTAQAGEHESHVHIATQAPRGSSLLSNSQSQSAAQPQPNKSTGMPAGLSPGEHAAYTAMINAGYPPSEWPALQQILAHESGANPAARNPDSGAYGMFQFLGHENDKYGALGAYSPSASQQSVAGMAYIQDRYGSPTNAWNFWQANNWYQSGGPIPGYGGGDTVPIMAEAGEYVFPKEDVSAMGGPAGVEAMRASLKGPTRIGGIYPQGGIGSGFRLGEGWAGDLLANAIQQGFTQSASQSTAAARGFQDGGLVVDPFNPQGPPPGPPPGEQPNIAFTPQGPLPGPDYTVFNPQGTPPGPEPHAGPTRIGGAETNFGIGAGSGAGGQGFGNTGVGGEVAGAAIGAGATALDALAPGAGQAAAIAANIAIKEITRAIGAGAQAVGAGAQGLLETFLPTGASQLASSNWLTRIAGGFAGAHPTLPNTAGMSQNKPATQPGPPPNPLAPATQTVPPPPQPIAYVPTGPAPGPTKEQGPTVNIENLNNYGPEESTALRIAEHARAAYSGATTALSGGR